MSDLKLMETIALTLKKKFGYTTFRPLQKNIIEDVLEKKDVFVLMPTGGGKSLCFQLPSIMLDGVTIVVSPLISLMKDQVDALCENGISASFLNSSLTQEDQEHVLTELESNNLRLLYVAPERLATPSFIQILKKLSINFFAIDEAHCISQWGHDFRPEYRQLHSLRTMFPKVSIIALTATATQRVKQDILSQLSLHNPSLYQASFNRPNLTYSVYPKKQSIQTILAYLQKHQNESGIIYCQSRNKVERMTEKLRAYGIKALSYHAGLPADQRRKNQESFITEDVDIIVATVAFGMGIDKPNVRFVIHADLPQSLEQYYQETGRAGRDGMPSHCLFFFGIGDKYLYDRFIQEHTDPTERQSARVKLDHVIAYAQSKSCRRSLLLRYFNETYEADNCQNCDNCLTPKKTFDGTVIAQKILSCVFRVGERFGITQITGILTGSKSQRIFDNKHNHLTTYNIVNDYSAATLKTFIYELIHLGFLKQSDDQYGILSLTTKSKAVLKGEVTVHLTAPETHETQTLKHGDDPRVDQALFEQLRLLRKKLADEAGVPPYVIFADKSLKEMTILLPKSPPQFTKIYGVGATKLNKYGDIFLKTIADYVVKQ